MNVFRDRSLTAPSRGELLRGLLFWALYLFLTPFLLYALFPVFRGEDLRSSFLYNLTVSVCNFLTVLLMFRGFLFRSRQAFAVLLYTCFFGFLASQALNSLWQILLLSLQSLLPEQPVNLNQELVNSFLKSYRGVMILDVALFTPFIEETLFRGLIFAPLCKKSPFLAYLVSMAAFAFLHVFSFVGVQHWSILLFSALQYLPSAFVLCWSYQKARSIWAPILLHGLLNLYSCIMILA